MDNSIFIPHVPHPLDEHYVFENDESYNSGVSKIINLSLDHDVQTKSWHEHFERLTYPCTVRVGSPLHSPSGNTILRNLYEMKLLKIAPIEKCPLKELVFEAKTNSYHNYVGYIFSRDINKYVSGNTEMDFILFRYWREFLVNKPKGK